MKKNIIPDINLQNDIQKNKILNSRDFYKGKSFRFAHEWHDGITYFNDDFYTDFVVYKNVLLACKSTHTSNSSNIPIIVYNGIQPVGVENTEFWSFVLSGIVNPDASFKVQFSPSVDALPKASEHVGEIFVVGPIGNSGNAYEEYLAIHTPSYDEEYIWELIGGGNVSIDLSNYVTKDDLNIYATKSEVRDGDKYLKNWVISEYSTTSEIEQLINEKGFISSIPPEYVTETKLNESNQELKTYIDNKNDYQDMVMSSKQPTLISGQNIKTINGEDILGEGNIVISVEDVDLTNYYTKEEIESKEYLTGDDIKTLVLDGGEIEFK